MASGTLASVPTLPQLLRETRSLRGDLAALMRRFPEDNVPPDDRIYHRLMDLSWRIRSDEKDPPPDDARKRTAIAWLDRLAVYLSDVAGYFGGVLGEPETLTNLPFHVWGRYSAEECLRRLALQEAALDRIGGESPGTVHQTHTERLMALRGRLEDAKALHGVKQIAADTKLHADTIQDFLAGRTSRLQARTIKKLEKYLQTM